jgi:carbonic anhydrase
MTQRPGIYLLQILLFLSCNATVKESKHVDSNSKPPADTAEHMGNNLVKNDAPDAETRQDQGYALPRQASRKAQSPIDLLSLTATKDGNAELAFNFPSQLNLVENLGHTIQLDFKPGSTWSVDGKNYEAKQIHFHTPSEHLIDGITYPMELHFVSTLKDADSNSNTSFLVVGLLFKMGKENLFLNEFLRSIPGEEGMKSKIDSMHVNLNDLLTQLPKTEKKPYFRYHGSLTTPPFTERVEWVVGKFIFEASPEQIFEIEKFEGNNARHVQEVNERKVAAH